MISLVYFVSVFLFCFYFSLLRHHNHKDENGLFLVSFLKDFKCLVRAKQLMLGVTIDA